MISFLLLPFRGLVWLTLGVVFSLPWLVILTPLLTPYWVPKAVSLWVEKNTGFNCHVGSAEVKYITGELTFSDVTISNPSNFYSSDFIKFKKVRVSFDMVSLFREFININELEISGTQLVSVDQNSNNIQLFCEKLGSNFMKKGYVIRKLSFNFYGLVSLRSYAKTQQSLETISKQNFYFSNVCWNVSDMYKMNLGTTCSLEDVYKKVSHLFLFDNK